MFLSKFKTLFDSKSVFLIKLTLIFLFLNSSTTPARGLLQNKESIFISCLLLKCS